MVSDTVIKAVSWTLVHSIWQGIILAFCAGLIITATKKSNAAFRYNLLCTLFVIFLFVTGLTFQYELASGFSETTLISNDYVVNNITDTIATGIINSTIAFLNNNANVIASVWLIVFALKLFGIFNAFSTIYRIRNYKTFAPPHYWNNRISDLAQLINIKKTIVLLESALVKNPCVTGFFKPVILVPIGLLSNLPQDQVEAILLHELAHIRRKDYAVNILQHLAEMIFFFNPAVLWLSSLIRDERENCCDDIALEIIGNKKDLVHALISFEEFNNENLAVAFAGKKKHLFWRVKRIIHNDNKTLNSVEKVFLSLSLLLVLIVTIAFTKPERNISVFKNENSAQKTQTITEATTTESTEETTDFQVQQTEVLKEETTPTTNESLYTVPSENEQIQACAPAPHIAIPENIQFSKTDSAKSKSVTTKSISTNTNYSKEVTVNNSDKINTIAKTKISIENFQDTQIADKLTRNIISDLISENLIDSTKLLSYALSDKSLVVNGVKQSEKVHAKLKNKYVKTKTVTICYNYEYIDDIY